MTPLFKKALEFILKSEGGYSNDPTDRGGATNCGITQRTYDTWLTKNKLNSSDVRNIPKTIVEQIYYQNYWKACSCDLMPDILATSIFDTAVNMGVGQAAKFLQSQLNESFNSRLIVDGAIGQKTIAELKKIENISLFTTFYLKRRLSFYDAIVEHSPEQKKYIKGWRNRIANLKKEIGI